MANEDDRIIWDASSNGEFNLNSAYTLANGEAPQFFNGKWIWKLKVLPRIQFFIWMCLHNSIATRERLVSRGLRMSLLCPLCNSYPETIVHLLRDCHVAANCWQNLGIGVCTPEFYSMSLPIWLENNCKSIKTSNHLQIPWSTIFAFGIWTIWNHRNSVVFKNKPINHSIHKEIIHKAVEYSFIAQNFSNCKLRIERSIRWERPNRGWHKLNTDGSSLGNPGLASGWGILRNEVGGWIRAFIRKIGLTTSFVAELWALRDGLSMCVDMQIPALEVELDAKVVADLMNNTTSLNADFAAIVADCRQLLSQIPQVKVSHCYREVNRCVDALARLGYTTSLNVMFFNFPPPP